MYRSTGGTCWHGIEIYGSKIVDKAAKSGCEPTEELDHVLSPMDIIGIVKKSYREEFPK